MTIAKDEFEGSLTRWTNTTTWNTMLFIFLLIECAGMLFLFGVILCM